MIAVLLIYIINIITIIVTIIVVVNYYFCFHLRCFLARVEPFHEDCVAAKT